MRNLSYLWRAFKLILPHRGMLAAYLGTAFGLAVCSSAPLILAHTFIAKLTPETVVRPPPQNPIHVFFAGLNRYLEAGFGTGGKYMIALCVLILFFWVLKATL